MGDTKFEILRDLLNDVMTSNTTKKDIFIKLFPEIPNPIKVSNGLSENIAKLSRCFDLNGDGTYDHEDLEYFKQMDMITILKIINASSYLTQLTKELSGVSFNNTITSDLVFKVIIYAIVYPLIGCEKFIEWGGRNNNKELFLEALESIYNVIKASGVVSSVAKKVKNMFSGCCKSSSVKDDVICDLEVHISKEVCKIEQANKQHLLEKKLLKLQEEVSHMPH